MSDKEDDTFPAVPLLRSPTGHLSGEGRLPEQRGGRGEDRPPAGIETRRPADNLGETAQGGQRVGYARLPACHTPLIVAIEADDYHYFTDELDLHGQTALWVESLCSRLFSSIVNRSSRIETLPSLIALDRIGLKLGGKLMEVVLRGG